MRILIADDDPNIRRCLSAQVAADGFDPVVCGNGEEALRILTAAPAPPIGLIDWIMPGLSGLDVCRALRNTALPIQPYLIIVTVKQFRVDITAALETGADDYMVKPFSMLELGTRIRVGRHNAEMQVALLDRTDRCKTATEQARTLRGLLPLCSACRKPRADPAYWEKVEAFFNNTHEDAPWADGLCPACAARLPAGHTREGKQPDPSL